MILKSKGQAALLTIGQCLIAACAQTIFVRDNATTLKGGTFQIICQMFLDINSTTSVYVTTSKEFGTSKALNQCTSNTCLTVSDNRYSFSADQNNIYINITSLNRQEDEKWWTCQNTKLQKAQLFLIVYTTPKSLQYSQNPSSNQDLALADVTLECHTDCSYPQPIIEWFYIQAGDIKAKWTNDGTSELSDGKCTENEKIYSSTLILPRYTTFLGNLDTSAKFQCIIRSFPGLTSELLSPLSTDIRFSVAASEPTLTNKTSGSLILFMGDTVNLECVSSPTRPAVTVLWKLDGVQHSNVNNFVSTVSGGLYRVQSVLTITAESRFNKKAVTCETYLDYQNPKPVAQIQLQVYWPPSQPAIKSEDAFPWFEGNTSRYLDCSSSDSGNPIAGIAWNTQIGQPEEGNSKRLKMPKLLSQHNGLSVACMLENEYTKRKGLIISGQVKLNVEYYPVIRINVDGVEVANATRKEGQNFSAVCIASGNPNPTVQWKTQVNSQLVLNDLNRTNDGLYECDATGNSIKYGKISSRRQLSLIVNYAANANVQFFGKLKEQTDMSIRCNASGKPNTYVFTNLTQTWNGLVLKVVSVDRNGEALVTNLTIQDSGNYTCMFNNGIPDKTGQLQQSATAEVLIKGKPKVTNTASSIFTGKLGENINITIPFYSYPAISGLSFSYQNGTTLPDAERYEVKHQRQKVTDVFHNAYVVLDGYVAILHIAKQDEYDFGDYILVLINTEGTTEWKFRHKSESVPNTPTQLKQLDEKATVSSVTLQWIPGFNGGLEQTFVLEYREIGTHHTETVYITHKGETEMTYTLQQLSSGKQYEVVLFAMNTKGPSKDALKILVTPVAVSTPGLNGAIIGGAVGGGAGCAILAVAVVVAVLFMRRRKMKNGTDTNRIDMNLKRRQKTMEDSSDEDVMVENKMYESAGQIMSKDKSVNNKLPKNIGTKKTDVYAVVDKTQKKGEKKEQKEIRREKKQFAQGDIYDNVPENNTYGNAAFEENPYENPEGSKPSQTQQTNIRQDGLIYADLAFNDQPKGRKKQVIHGLDQMTTYVQVDFNRKADSLPDSDIEEQPKNKIQ